MGMRGQKPPRGSLGRELQGCQEFAKVQADLMQVVYYLGPEGTFSHILALKRFGKKADLRRCDTIDAVVEASLKDPTSLGLVPVENSSGGTVYDTVDLLIRNCQHVHVVEELALDVRIALLAKGDNVPQTIYSHFIQLKHHAEWLHRVYPYAQLRAVSSTALAAKKAASSKTAAALASPGTALIHGLKILKEPPNKGTLNVTHFFIIQAGRPAPIPSSPLIKTALVAALPNVCGSLHKFLGPFARQKISLSRIVSRPVPGKPQTYVFFAEIEGNSTDPTIARVIERAGKLSESLVSLGSFTCGKRYKS